MALAVGTWRSVDLAVGRRDRSTYWWLAMSEKCVSLGKRILSRMVRPA